MKSGEAKEAIGEGRQQCANVAGGLQGKEVYFISTIKIRRTK